MLLVPHSFANSRICLNSATLFPLHLIFTQDWLFKDSKPQKPSFEKIWHYEKGMQWSNTKIMNYLESGVHQVADKCWLFVFLQKIKLSHSLPVSHCGAPGYLGEQFGKLLGETHSPATSQECPCWFSSKTNKERSMWPRLKWPVVTSDPI